jgi:RNAse (barnase) inhibitor barstar
MKFYAQISQSGKIVAEYDSDHDALKKLKRDTTLLFDVKQERNSQHHRKFFALVNMVFQNQEVFNNIEHLRKELTIESGFYDEYRTFDGELKREAKSISFANMDQTEFNELYSKFCDTIIRVMGWDMEMIEENLESFL